jgi:hypothetical protein
MSKELKKFRRNLSEALILSHLLPRSIGLPRTVLNKFFIKSFQDMYFNDFTRVLSYIRDDDEESARKYAKSMLPVIEKRVELFRKKVERSYGKIKKQVLNMQNMKKISRRAHDASIVLMVAYFEDFLKEVFVDYLNKNPRKSLIFLEKQLRVEHLKEFGFNLSKKMGSLLAEKINFQNLNAVEKNYKRLFGLDFFNKDLALKRNIIKLFQTRHLIVHNDGKIDRKFIKLTKVSDKKLGKEIILTVKDIEKYKKCLTTVATFIDDSR